MKHENWLDHLNHWQAFLDERIAQVDDFGEKTKILRQRKVLEEVRFAAVLNPRLLLEFINPKAIPTFQSNNLDYHLNLNDSQKRAVALALNENVLSLIQGPPGTGKTQVITEICLQLYKNNPNIRILICSETHIAVNNLISRLSASNDSIRIVRIRDKEQDNESDRFSPESIIKHYANWLRQCLENEELAEVIIDSVSQYDNRSLEKALALSANVAGMTCNRVGAYSFDTSNEMFDVVIIDEVCKATLPEILMPLTISKKAILVGDPKQLPPIFCSEEIDVIRSIENCDLQKYMYIDHLFSRSQCVTILDTQYRMAERIGSLVGTLFYSGQLINGRVSSSEGSITWIDYTPSQSWPIMTDGEEYQRIYNMDECTIVSSVLHQMDTENNVNLSVAVIAPYRNQVSKLRQIVRESQWEHIVPKVDTVDGFQGKESDVVVFSLTRTHGPFRFLADKRRLNVALSRAKDQLIMIGSLDYARTNPLLRKISLKCDIRFVESSHLTS